MLEHHLQELQALQALGLHLVRAGSEHLFPKTALLALLLLALVAALLAGLDWFAAHMRVLLVVEKLRPPVRQARGG